MTYKTKLVIKDGKLHGFEDDLKRLGLLTQHNHTSRRVSTIRPSNFFLRWAFIILRALVSKESSIASWTRTWPCRWRVDIDGQFHGYFYDRLKAIDYEKSTINIQDKI